MAKRITVLLLSIALLLVFSGSRLVAQETKEIPKKAVKLVEKAVEDIKAKAFDKAAEKLAEAKTLAPDYAPIYLHLSALSQQNQNMDEAMTYMAKAYELDAASDAIIHQYAILMLKSAQQKMAANDKAAALALYEKFVLLPGIKAKLSAQFVQVAYTLAGTYLQSGESDKVIRYSTELLATPGVEAYKQPYLFAHFLMGSAYGQKNETEKSIEYLKKFLDLNQENLAPAQFVSLADYLIASSHFALMEKEIEALKKEDLEGIRKTAEAKTEMVKYLNDALAVDAQNREAKFSLAKYHYYCLNYEGAAALLKELLAAEPGNNDYKTVLDIVSKAQEAKNKKK